MPLVKLFVLPIKKVVPLAERYKNVGIFLAGFLFDAFTIKRIDAWTDLCIQLVYLMTLTFLLIYQYKDHHGLWAPGKWIGKFWKYNVELLHFLYGGLLSAYVILYSKSSTGTRSLFFFVLLAILLITNEMPQVKRFGYRLRLGLYAFCVSSFLIYFIPILMGHMGDWIFCLALLLAGGIVWVVAHQLAKKEENMNAVRLRLFMPAGILLLLILVAYFYRLIPPVPLSLQHAGIYHHVEKKNRKFILTALKPPFYVFWKKESRPFRFRPGDHIYYFARIYAPARFKHQVMIRWEHYDPNSGGYKVNDHVPFPVKGGRLEGFRGTLFKSKFKFGKHRITAETSDGRAIGILKFKVFPDKKATKRKWVTTKM